jgi:clorobiocin biosynthesis protein CloN5
MTDERVDVLERLTVFFQEKIVSAAVDVQLGPDSPLRELGVINSLGMARLVSFIRDDLGVAVPTRELTGRNFRTLGDIADLVLGLRADAR